MTTTFGKKKKGVACIIICGFLHDWQVVMNSDLKLLKILDRVGNCLPCHLEYVLQCLIVSTSALGMSNTFALIRILILFPLYHKFMSIQLCPPLYLPSPSYSINPRVHNQTTKVSLNFLDQEKCFSKCHSDILAQKLPLKIIGEG